MKTILVVKKSPPSLYVGRRGLVELIKNKSLLLSYLLHRSVSKADNVDATFQSIQFLTVQRIDAYDLVQARCSCLLDSIGIGRFETLLGNTEDGGYLARCHGSECDAFSPFALVCGKRVFEDAEVGASVKLVGAVTVAAATLDAVEACLVFLRDLYC